MERITAYFLSLLEVIEKELLLLKRLAAKTVLGLCLIAMGVFLLGVGLMALIWTCFMAMSGLIGPVGAGLLSSVMVLLAGGVFLWASQRSLK